MTKGLPLATSTWDERELDAMNRVIGSGRFTMGPEVESFESEFAAFVGSRHCVMVNSGSSANLLAVASLFFIRENSLQPGDEVIVPAVSWATTYAPLQQYGLKVVFVDVDPGTFNLDLDQVARAISPRTRLIFCVNLLGNPVDYPKLEELVADRGIYILEDNCEAMGATIEGKQAGTFGIAGTFSTFFSHHISTMEGGMVVTDDDELYHILLSLRAHGWTRDLPDDNLVARKSPIAFEESFRFVLPGYNLRPLEMSAAIGREQIIKLPAIIEGRRANAARFRDLFTEHALVEIQREVGKSSWFGFAFVLRDDSVSRSDLLHTLDDNGFESRPIVAGNFARNPVIRYFDHEVVGQLEAADRIHDRGFFVGNHHFDISDELDALAGILADAG